ncbi:hypothetical protein P43SY_009202 [Pythium insidiosum]|uniref:RRM domain-containing protein n=1 Tax=Pythium insidiosum TaxID=114742 RepID=A0AAD5QE55_PYTIN|nr:hypothetical protein P43SY_009202 [Pythium insidiosum]KAJ0411780.1 hypothetical protein ATCC90586_006739 [Pythium insidiosum]
MMLGLRHAVARHAARPCARSRSLTTHVSVIGLHWKTDEVRLRQAFSGYGKLESAELIQPAHSTSHLWARLAYSNFEEALAAVSEMNGQELDGRLLRVSFADPPVNKQEKDNKAATPQKTA